MLPSHPNGNTGSASRLARSNASRRLRAAAARMAPLAVAQGKLVSDDVRHRSCNVDTKEAHHRPFFGTVR